MRIVFMGTPDFAVPCLARLISDGHEIAGVFTQPDKPVGRHAVLTPPPVKILAAEKGIPVYQPVKLRDGKALAILEELAPQMIVVVAYGRILPESILNCAPLGCVNVHGSLLPKYRGAAPIQWSVLNGDKITGVTTMYMDKGMDTGDIIDVSATEIGENETSGELFERLSAMGAQLLSKTVSDIEAGKIKRTKQNETEATAAPMLTKEMGKIDFSRSAAEIHNLVRGLSPWPTAYIRTAGKTVKIHASRLAGEAGSGKAGEILDSSRMIVACGQGSIELLTVQPEGKGKMPAQAYMNGARLKKGDSLIKD